MKKIIVLSLLSFGWLTTNAQDVKQIFIALGGTAGTHQNQTFSSSALSGTGLNIQLGGVTQSKNLFRWQLEMPIQSNTIHNQATTKSTIFEPSISFAWMKGLHVEDANRWYVGAEIELAALFRSTANLGNNGKSLLYNNTLSIASRIERPIGNSQWHFGGDVSIGLISWVKASDGYAFSAPQDFLTNGQFNYDEDASIAPYKYGELALIGQFNRVKTDFSLFKDTPRSRWGIKYNWYLRAYQPFKDGQMVQGTHGLSFFFGLKLGRNKANTQG